MAKPLRHPMLSTSWGRVINISSVTGITANRGQIDYAAKAGLHDATESLALKLTTRKVIVNVAAPGLIGGPITGHGASTLKRLIPMQRFRTPEGVAALVGLLASERAAYISGQIINVNGFTI